MQAFVLVNLILFFLNNQGDDPIESCKKTKPYQEPIPDILKGQAIETDLYQDFHYFDSADKFCKPFLSYFDSEEFEFDNTKNRFRHFEQCISYCPASIYFETLKLFFKFLILEKFLLIVPV